ncbi:TPA: hypothetical protein DEA21_04790 [Candidatus Uhrbacteria bacterium]|nr:hypothetical protein [Candidatus Uhrbacteria bacterium]
MNKILVTCYADPDLDGTASALAYAEFLNKTGRPAVAGVFGEPSVEAEYLLDRFKIKYPLKLSTTADFEQIVLTDASTLSGLDGNIDPKAVIEIIDHRKVNEAEKFFKAKVQIELVGAAATLVAERFFEKQISMSSNAAKALAGAVISNTLNFHGPVVSDRDRSVFDRLNQISALPENFAQEMFLAKSDLSGKKLFERMRSDLAGLEFAGQKIAIVQLEIVGAEGLLAGRGGEIVEILKKIKNEQELAFCFINIIDLEKFQNYFLAADDESEKLFEKVLCVVFKNHLAIRKELLMRKQIVSLIKKELER